MFYIIFLFSLLTYSCNVYSLDPDLCQAIQQGDDQRIEQFLQQGHSAEDALHYAVRHGGSFIFGVICKHVNNINVPDGNGRSPLDRAVQLKQYAKVKTLLQCNANPDQGKIKELLQVAKQKSRHTIRHLLLEHRDGQIDLVKRDKIGETLIEKARRKHQNAWADYLQTLLLDVNPVAAAQVPVSPSPVNVQAPVQQLEQVLVSPAVSPARSILAEEKYEINFDDILDDDAVPAPAPVNVQVPAQPAVAQAAPAQACASSVGDFSKFSRDTLYEIKDIFDLHGDDEVPLRSASPELEPDSDLCSKFKARIAYRLQGVVKKEQHWRNIMTQSAQGSHSYQDAEKNMHKNKELLNLLMMMDQEGAIGTKEKINYLHYRTCALYKKTYSLLRELDVELKKGNLLTDTIVAFERKGKKFLKVYNAHAKLRFYFGLDYKNQYDACCHEFGSQDPNISKKYKEGFERLVSVLLCDDKSLVQKLSDDPNYNRERISKVVDKYKV